LAHILVAYNIFPSWEEITLILDENPLLGSMYATLDAADLFDNVF